MFAILPYGGDPLSPVMVRAIIRDRCPTCDSLRTINTRWMENMPTTYDYNPTQLHYNNCRLDTYQGLWSEYMGIWNAEDA